MKLYPKVCGIGKSFEFLSFSCSFSILHRFTFGSSIQEIHSLINCVCTLFVYVYVMVSGTERERESDDMIGHRVCMWVPSISAETSFPLYEVAPLSFNRH
jgi:hypothetical protein